MSEEIKNEAAENAAEGVDGAKVAVASKKKSKKFVVVGVVCVVLIVAVAGAWAWHNTPSFCGAVCHNTMSAHLANYEGTDDSNGAGIASVHAKANVGCLDCHEAHVDEQISEVQSQLSGAGEPALSSTYYDNNEKCLSCHGGSYEELAKQTSSLGDFNPHSNPHGQMNCNECHKGHSSQVDTCSECHSNGGQQMVN